MQTAWLSPCKTVSHAAMTLPRIGTNRKTVPVDLGQPISGKGTAFALMTGPEPTVMPESSPLRPGTQ